MLEHDISILGNAIEIRPRFFDPPLTHDIGYLCFSTRRPWNIIKESDIKELQHLNATLWVGIQIRIVPLLWRSGNLLHDIILTNLEKKNYHGRHAASDPQSTNSLYLILLYNGPVRGRT